MIDRYANPKITAAWSRASWVRDILRAEAATLQACIDHGVIDHDADALVKHLRNVSDDGSSIALLSTAAALKEKAVGHDVVALLAAINDDAAMWGVPTSSRRWLHFGLTSSDVVDVHVATAIGKTTEIVLGEVDSMVRALSGASNPGKTSGRTHGRFAAPTSWDHRLTVIVGRVSAAGEQLIRAGRDALTIALSGAVGHPDGALPYEVRLHASGTLGLALTTESTQVVPRYRVAVWIQALAALADAVRDLATQIRLAAISGVDELETKPADGYVGSSAMPGKVNPTSAETACGLAIMARHYAAAVSEASVLWFDRDICHSSIDRIALPGAAHCVAAACERVTRLLGQSKFVATPRPRESSAAANMMQATRDGVCRWDSIG